MGGRGSRSSGGHRAPNGYSTVGKIRGVRVIQDKKTGKGLPFRGPRNGSFYRKSRSGAVEQYRKYDSKGFPKKDLYVIKGGIPNLIKLNFPLIKY